jgi:hypothetical protein
VAAAEGASGEVETQLAVVADDEKWVRPQRELHSVQPLPAPDPEMMRQLSLGTLDVTGLPLDTVRSMMRPEPDQPSETEANMSGFMP